MNLDETLRAAIAAHGDDAVKAIATVAEWCGREKLQSMNSGSSAGVRICWKMYHGASLERATADEYMYRWHLPLNQWVNHAENSEPGRRQSIPITGAWPVPHLIGM